MKPSHHDHDEGHDHDHGPASPVDRSAPHEHPHGHGHSHGRDASARRLTIVLGLVLLYMGAEVIGGLLANSLALLADAGHMLSDAAALALALFAMRIAKRPPTRQRTYGYHRAEILAALVNGTTLVVIAIFIVIEAWDRFREPPEVAGGLMMAVATGGLVVNLIGLWVLHGGRDESLNMRGAWLHVLGDALGSVQAIVAGGLIVAYGWSWVDPLASVLIAVLVAWSAQSLLRESVDVLMESAPKHIDIDEVRRVMLEVEGAIEVHDLHCWTITSGNYALSAHVGVRGRSAAEVLFEIDQRLDEVFHIAHTTIQIEPEAYPSGEVCAPCATPSTAAPETPTPSST